MSETITVIVPPVEPERMHDLAVLASGIVGKSNHGAIGISVTETRDMATGFLALFRFALAYRQLQDHTDVYCTVKKNDEMSSALKARRILTDDLAAQIGLLVTKEAN